jgi:hypothetical protein
MASAGPHAACQESPHLVAVHEDAQRRMGPVPKDWKIAYKRRVHIAKELGIRMEIQGTLIGSLGGYPMSRFPDSIWGRFRTIGLPDPQPILCKPQ